MMTLLRCPSLPCHKDDTGISTKNKSPSLSVTYKGYKECTFVIGIDSFRCTRPQSSSRIMHRKTEMSKRKRGHRVLTWKTQQLWEKPRQPTDCRKSLWEKYNNGETQRQRPLAPLLRHTQWLQMEATTSLSLSISYTLSLYTVTLYTHTTTKMFNNIINYFCPKSYLYTYDFRAIYTYGPKGLT